MDTNKIPEEILREWIEKARPLVDSAYNLAIDSAIGIVGGMGMGIDPAIIASVIDRLATLKNISNGNAE